MSQLVLLIVSALMVMRVGADYNSAINGFTAACTDQVFTCLTKTEARPALYYYMANKYCEAITYNTQSFSSQTCLVTNGNCSYAEYAGVKNAVCVPDYNSAINAVTAACQDQIFTCLTKTEAQSALYYYMANKYCEAITYNTQSFSSLTCLVTNGNCSNAEYDGVKNAVCGATTLVVGAASFVLTMTLLLYNRC